ncbi:hypothetical protein VUR80DRAFT_5130 [Thermomyces stellatus]
MTTLFWNPCWNSDRSQSAPPTESVPRPGDPWSTRPPPRAQGTDPPPVRTSRLRPSRGYLSPSVPAHIHPFLACLPFSFSLFLPAQVLPFLSFSFSSPFHRATHLQLKGVLCSFHSLLSNPKPQRRQVTSTLGSFLEFPGGSFCVSLFVHSFDIYCGLEPHHITYSP